MQYFAPEEGSKNFGWLPVPASHRTTRPNVKSAQAAERSAIIAAELGSFKLVLDYCDERRSPLRSLELTVGRAVGRLGSLWLAEQISRQDAERLVEHLADDGFLVRSVDALTRGDRPPGPGDRPPGPEYRLSVEGGHETEYHCYFEDLGWGPEMYARLKGLRGALTGPAANAMDKLLKPLEARCKQPAPPPKR
jgi:hypothetical protein